MKKPICPRIGKACIQEKCVRYVGFELTKNTMEGPKTVQEWDCLDYWQVFFQRQHVQRMDEMGASMDKLRGQVARQAAEGNVLLQLFQEAVNGQQAQPRIKNTDQPYLRSHRKALDQGG